MTDYPQRVVPVNHVEPVPRRIRAVLGDRVVLDTTAALYVWEWPHYPQYYIPIADLDAGLLVDEQHEEQLRRGTARRYGLRVGDQDRPGVAHHFTESELEGVTGTVRLDWSALDSWFEEDEVVFVHPRDPYSRVDALRSTRAVTVELEGTELARSSSTVMVFETGLPTRYYFNRTEVRFEHLTRTDTVTASATRERPATTGRSTSGAGSSPISPGRTTSPRATCRPSRGWSASTTRRSTSRSTASG